MRKINQVESGKAFEYSIAVELSNFLHAPFIENTSKFIAEDSFNAHSHIERKRMQRAADEATIFLACSDDRMEHAIKIYLQSDDRGMKGDFLILILCFVSC